MKKTDHAQLRFPRLNRVDFETFSLFAQQPNLRLSITRGVTCLAGANGIGKSTFLAAVNFALTGRVPLPVRSYSSSDEYYRESSTFARVFFEGRINEDDRSTAAISVEFEIAGRLFAITRGFFDPDGLRALSVRRLDGATKTLEVDGGQLSDSARQQEYARLVTEMVGLKSFDQFVFLQHFVFTFDESRNLLFWNEKALEAALFIAFGGDPEQHAAADNERRDMERAESLGRNVKWQSLQVRKRIDVIREALGGTGSEDIAQLIATYKALESEMTRALENAESADAKAADRDLALANSTAELLALRNEYAKAFARHVGERRAATQHPLILEAITERRCALCGATGDNVSATIQRRMNANVCPFCETALHGDSSDGTELEELKRLDENIVKARKRMETLSAARDRITAEREEARRRANAATAVLHEFEEKHTDIAHRVQGEAATSAGGALDELARLAAELKSLLRLSKDHYKTRDRHKTALQQLQQQLEQQYKAMEEKFVPLFRRLAEHFIGFDLDIAYERRTSGFSLVLELRSTRRRVSHQLSESQRFFLDIALRMALAQFVSQKDTSAPLYIDTPEGSLDIAYEARAGEMFAEFVRDGNDIIMTANINTSQLLKKLAAKCGSKHMTLVRMTDWTDLSEVQVEEESLFRDAYKDIEKELRAGGS